MNSKFRKYLYKAGTLSMSGIMALSLCAPALTASANNKPRTHRSAVQRVYFWDNVPTAHHKRHAHKHAKNTNRKSKKNKRTKKSKAKRSQSEARDRQALEHDKTILRQMDEQLNQMTHQLHHKRAQHLYQTLRRNGYSYNQSIVILASIERNTHGTYKNTYVKYDAMGYFFFGGSYMRAYNRYARRTHQKRWQLIPQLNFMNRGSMKRGHKSFKRAKGTQYKLYKQFESNMLDEHGYFVPSHHQLINQLRLARIARKG